jgi:uncharacterized SAM-binding protein YcdF (DUF218 family)
VTGVRLIAVLGYSSRRGEGLHERCSARLRRGEQEARAHDVVLLSGWARGRNGASEAEQMARSWNGPRRRIVLDRTARSTVANVAGAATLARKLQAQEVVLVTSSWHAPRAGALLRSALRGSGSTIIVAPTDERGSLGARLRELACWAVVPVAALAFTARRRSNGVA